MYFKIVCYKFTYIDDCKHVLTDIESMSPIMIFDVSVVFLNGEQPLE